MKESLKEQFEKCRRTYVTVDLDAIAENMKNMKNNIPEGTRMIGVIKTDGYGHGAVPIAGCLEKFDFMYGFAVATAEEAHILRMAGITKPILILGYTFPYSYEMLIREEVRPVVFRYDTIVQLEEAAQKVGRRVKVHVKVDTGMSRIGITPDDEGLSYVRELMQHKDIEIEGIFTHFAKADEADKTDAVTQYHRFDAFVKRIEEELGLIIPVKHCANSAGILEIPESGMDVVRAGISLYGLYPSDEVSRDSVSLRPALSWYSEVIYLKTIHKGQSVSYGGIFTADREMKVATVPVGYGDGYPRQLTGKGYVLICKKAAPIIGRICMDQFMVDVTDIPEVKEGTKVTLIGRDGEACITAEEIGDLSGRFHYELICDISKRVPRVYLKNNEIATIKDYNSDYE